MLKSICFGVLAALTCSAGTICSGTLTQFQASNGCASFGQSGYDEISGLTLSMTGIAPISPDNIYVSLNQDGSLLLTFRDPIDVPATPLTFTLDYSADPSNLVETIPWLGSGLEGFGSFTISLQDTVCAGSDYSTCSTVNVLTAVDFADPSPYTVHAVDTFQATGAGGYITSLTIGETDVVPEPNPVWMCLIGVALLVLARSRRQPDRKGGL